MKNTSLLDCKNILREDKDYNIEKNILPSEVQIIDRLLTRDADMVSVYEEIHGLGLIEKQLILRGILNVGAFWNPQAAKDFRVDRKKLEDVNYKIGETAAQLAELLEAREYLHNHSGFSSDTHYCVLNALENAAEGNYLYSSYVKEKIAKLRGQYDSKYWPGVENFVLELSYDAIN